VRPTAVAPDHSAYAYVTGLDSPDFELHVVDGRTGSDRVLWAASGGIDFPIEWAADGIHVTTVPSSGGATQGWVVDPASGDRRAAAGPRITAEFGRTNIGTFFGTMPYEAVFLGMPVVRDATAGVYLAGPRGRRTLIHALTADFDPSTFVVDGDRLWAVNADGSAVWLWTPKDGLRRFPIRSWRQAGVWYWAAGPCA
jgi:hypothetical protein